MMCKPHFATPYPGSEWFTVYRKQIEEQYKGQGKQKGLTDDLEAYIVDLGDASRISAVISKNFNAVELIGLREMMLHRQYDKIDAYEKEWREKHKIPEGHPSTLCQTVNSKKDSKIKQLNQNTNNLKIIK